jgi:hypothetical protein
MKLSESDIAPHQTLGHTGKRFSLFAKAEVEWLSASTVWLHDERFESLYCLWLFGLANDNAGRHEFEQAVSE